MRYLRRSGNDKITRQWLRQFLIVFLCFQIVWLIYLIPYVIPAYSGFTYWYFTETDFRHLNQHLEKGFAEFVNEYRVEEFKQRIANQELSRYSVAGLATDCGFSSLATFQRRVCLLSRKDVTIILLKNSGNYGEDVWPVAMGLSDIMFGKPYDLWKLRKAISVPENILKEYEGKYVLEKTRVSFVVRDHQLLLVLADGSQIGLLAESTQTFFLHIFNTTVHFIRDDEGKITKAIIHEHGKDDVYRRKL